MKLPPITPGPWRVSVQSNVLKGGDNGEAVVCDLNGVGGWDARAIAQVPAMLELLVEWRARMPRTGVARNVIAKTVERLDQVLRAAGVELDEPVATFVTGDVEPPEFGPGRWA